METRKEIQKRPEGNKEFRMLPISLEIGFSIAIPLVLLALLGRLLDRYLESSPLFLLVGVFIAMVVSSVIIYVKMRPYL